MRSVNLMALVCCLVALAGCASAPRALQAPDAAGATRAVNAGVERQYAEALDALEAKRLDQAANLLLALTRAHPQLAGPYVNLGMLHARRHEWDKAEVMLRRALAVNPMRADAYNELGIVLRYRGRFDEARAAYERALQLEPGYANAQLNLGILYDLYLLQPAQALRHYERYQQLRPDEQVGKWIVELKRRTDATPKTAMSRQP